jgi:predicted DNA-binding protein with PD1-like motif
MEYKRFNDMIVARIDKGEEIMQQVRIISETEGIRLASITAIGATDDFTVGIFDRSKGAYNRVHHTGDHEITSIVGNITTIDGNFRGHMHITCSDIDGNIVGGHMLETNISLTCEMMIRIIDGVVDRQHDDELNIDTLFFQN